MRRLLFVVLALCAVLFVGRTARADEECAPGNLLVNAPVSPPLENAAVLTDGIVAEEESPWPPSDVVVAVHGPLTWDLGAPAWIGQIYFQIDADQPVEVSTSVDGEVWKTFGLPADAKATGMIGRALGLQQRARFVRISTPHPSQTLALTEAFATCDPMVRDWSADVRAVGRVVPAPRRASIAPITVDVMKLFVVVAALVVFALARSHRRDAITVGLAVVAVAAYFNFGDFRYPRYVHEHEVFHYFVGAKYFPELGYDRLYDCATAAEAEAGFVERIELRSQRDLRTNALVKGTDILERSADCRASFGAERWKAFVHDVSWFAAGRDVEDWHRVLRDHGFNATPTWIALAAPIARSLPAADWSIGTIVAPLDPLLLALAFAAVVWAFDRRIASLAVIVFACNPLSDFAWLGGAFLRQLWLATLVIGICFVAKKRGVVAGIALGLSSLLQIFPAACLGSLAVAAAFVRFRDPFYRRLFLAAAITVVLAVPLSAWVAGHPGTWSAFAKNTSKHARTPSANLVGFKTALSFRPSTRAELLFDENAIDPFARIRAARADNYGWLAIVHLAAVVAALLAVVRAARRKPPDAWMAALGIALVPIVLETSSYYTSYLVVAALCARESSRMALPILGAIAIWLLAQLAGYESDTRHAIASWVLTLAIAACLALAARKADAVTSG